MLLASPQTICYSYGYMYTCVHHNRTWNILADVPLQLQSLFMTVLSNFNIYKLTTNNIAIAMAQLTSYPLPWEEFLMQERHNFIPGEFVYEAFIVGIKGPPL